MLYRKMLSVRRVLGRIFDRFHIDDSRVRQLRRLSTLGIALGFTIIVSNFIFPRLPAILMGFLPIDYHGIAEALLLDEAAAGLILGSFILLFSSVMHLSLDIYLDTVGVPWRFKGDEFLKLLGAVSFALSFLTARVLVVLSGIVGVESDFGMAGFIPVREIWFQGYHIHHFFFGFLALTYVGWKTVFSRDFSPPRMAVLYGAGLGIFVDEIGMLLTEGDYFATSSYFVAIVFMSLVLAGLHWDRISSSQSVSMEEMMGEGGRG